MGFCRLLSSTFVVTISGCSLFIDVGGLAGDATPVDAPDAAEAATDGPRLVGDPVDAGALEAEAPSIPCSTLPMTSWEAPRRLNLLGDNGALYFEDPSVSADGLTLWASKRVAACEHAIYRGTRARDQSFATLVKQDVPGIYCAPPYPSEVVADEVFLSAQGGGGSAVSRASRAGNVWTTIPIAGFDTSDFEFSQVITQDRVYMLFNRAGANPQNPFSIFITASRSGPTATVWRQEQQPAAPPNYVPSSIAMTSDGLGLFWSTKDARVWFLKRATRGEDIASRWASAIEIPALEGGAARVRSITADGCEVYLTSDRGGVTDTYVAKRR